MFLWVKADPVLGPAPMLCPNREGCPFWLHPTLPPPHIGRLTPCRFSLRNRNKVAHSSYSSQSHVLKSCSLIEQESPLPASSPGTPVPDHHLRIFLIHLCYPDDPRTLKTAWEYYNEGALGVLQPRSHIAALCLISEPQEWKSLTASARKNGLNKWIPYSSS